MRYNCVLTCYKLEDLLTGMVFKTKQELASELGVSTKTVHRFVEILSLVRPLEEKFIPGVRYSRTKAFRITRRVR